MDDDGGLGMRNWGGYYDQTLKGNLGLQLMSSVNERETTKPYFFFSNNGFNPEPSSVSSMNYMRESWIHHYNNNRDNCTSNPNNNNNTAPNTNKLPHYYDPIPNPSMSHTLQILNSDDRVPVPENTAFHANPNPNPNPDLNPNESPSKKKKKKKRPQNNESSEIKPPKPKKPKKDNSLSNGKRERNSTSNGETDHIVINGIDLDLAKVPTPVCSCTGSPQQCYRWGVGGWQSACCTNSISVYPLPLSDKRRGARIAGRKMSQGAFRKVLERVAGEGCDLSQPIDLRNFWAKHGTNKFVTIR